MMDVAPAGAAAPEVARFWELWRGLPRHPNLLEVMAARTLRFAALDWRRLVDAPDASSMTLAEVATWGIELARVYELVAARVAPAERGWLARPSMQVDLEGALRVAFVPPPYAPGGDVHHLDERALVDVVGRALGALVSAAAVALEPIRRVLARCVAPDPARRFTTLRELIEALVTIGGHRRPPLGLREGRHVWGLVETGLGLLALGRLDQALAPLETALAEEQRTRGPRIAVLAASIAAIKRGPPRLDGQAPDTLAEATHGCLRSGRGAEALALADRWLTSHHDDARAHLARGKALVQLGRPADAHAAFERACVAGPQLLEAMWLRRELARTVTAVRVSAGTSRDEAPVIPAHLTELREVLVRGQPHDALDLLRQPRHHADPIAQRFLASLLAFEGRHAEVLDVLAHVLTLGDEHRPQALLGQAEAHLALGDASAALSRLDHLAREAPGVPGTLDARIRALRQLGRHADADAAEAGAISAAADAAVRMRSVAVEHPSGRRP